MNKVRVIKTCIELYRYLNKQRQYGDFGRDNEVSQDCFFVYSTNIELFHPQLGPVVHFLRCRAYKAACVQELCHEWFIVKIVHVYSSKSVSVFPDFKHPRDWLTIFDYVLPY